MFFLIPLGLGLLLAALHAFIRRKSLNRAGTLRLFICYMLVVGFGLSGLMGFVGHALRPESVAATIGWPAHPLFQFELASFELGYAFAAFLGLWIRKKSYWLGFSLPPSVFLVLAAFQHLHEALAKGNLAPYNVITIAPDLLIPGIFLGLLAALYRSEK